MTSSLTPDFSPPPDDDGGTVILASCIPVVSLALFAVTARMYVRLYIIRSVGHDDFAILVAMLLSLIGFCIIIQEILEGAGHHIELLALEMVSAAKLHFVTQPIYLWSIAVAKISIALFLLRLTPHQVYRSIIWYCIVFLVLYTAGSFCSIMTECIPLEAVWNKSIEGRCYSLTTLRGLVYVNTVISMLTDIIFSVLPICILWNVQIRRRVKFILAGILCLGFLAALASALKVPHIQEYGLSASYLYNSRDMTIWTVVECNFGILAASIPCLKPLFRKWFERSKDSSSGIQSPRLPGPDMVEEARDFPFMTNWRANVAHNDGAIGLTSSSGLRTVCLGSALPSSSRVLVEDDVSFMYGLASLNIEKPVVTLQDVPIKRANEVSSSKAREGRLPNQNNEEYTS